MLDVLPVHTRTVLLGYDFITQYLEGKMSKSDFLSQLSKHKMELLSKGVEKEYLELISDTDDEAEFHRKASYSRFVMFARKLGLDVATKQDKVLFLKSITAEKFLDLLSIGAGLLRGTFSLQRWRDRKEEKIIVSSIWFGTQLEPPDNSSKEFIKFFELMQKDITPSNMDVWAVKLYFAIICAHIFSNGNGRLARNAYFLLKSNGLLDERRSSTRTNAVEKACRELNIESVALLMEKEGIHFKDLASLAADEEYDGQEAFEDRGIVQQLKYIAARRVLIRNKAWEAWGEPKLIAIKNFRPHLWAQYQLEYQKVRQEWFWMCIFAAGKYYGDFGSILDETLIK